MKTDTLPKRRNAAKTKAKILAAAQQAFSEQGYSQAGIRDIAALAEVSSPMLLRYFGSKSGLFEAALINSITTEELFTVDKNNFGEKLAELLTDEKLIINPPSMITLSTGDSVAREIITRVTEEYLLSPLAQWLGTKDAKIQATEVLMLAMGFFQFTRQIPLFNNNRKNQQEINRRFARSVQAIINNT